MSAHRPGPARTRGITLVEVSTAVAVVGVLGLLAAGAYADFAVHRARAQARADAEAARQAIRAFALRNKRLPCPDASGNGREAVPCGAGLQVGWLPYESLGLSAPEPSRRMRYAVTRAGTDADAVAPPAPSADDLEGLGPIRKALATQAARPVTTSAPYLTGRGTPAEPENCATSVRANPAFAVIAPITDRDDTGGPPAAFDGVNHAMAASGRLCIASPGRALDAGYDDVVVAESASALLGWLVTHTR